MRYIREGTMKPVIDSMLGIDEARAGVKLLEDREVFGKVIVSP
jgi:alcohol dehydrogenase